MTLSPSYPEPAAAAANDGRAAKAAGAPAGLLGRVTIRTRLIVLSSALLIILVGTNLYLTRKLSTNAAGMVETAELLRTIEQANNAQLAFGQVRYWMMDLAVSLLTLPEANAKAAHARLEGYLDQLAPKKPEAIAAVRTQIVQFDELAAKAVEEYTNDRRVIGNSLLAQARQHSVAVDKLLGSIVAELNQDAVAARDRVVAEAGLATRLSQIVTVATVLAGALLTFFVLRSIARPLRRLVVAMDGLNAGNSAVDIPAPGSDEMGAMARTLAAFRDTTQELHESLEYQTATSDVLQVISRSTFDLQPVLQTLAETALRLCEAEQAYILRRDGEVYRAAAAVGSSPENVTAASEYQTYLETHPITPGRGTLTGRVAVECRAIQIADVASDPEYTLTQAVTLGNIHTQLGVPLLRQGEPIGVMILSRQQVEPFTERQIELVRTFADQAVIAIENTRLLTELRESLEQQQAIAEVLGIINSSPGDLTPVFDAILDKAHALCGVVHGTLQLYDGESFRAVAVHGYLERLAGQLRQGYRPGPSHPFRPLIDGGRILQIPDLAQIDDPVARSVAEMGGIRTTLVVALRKDAALLGVITAGRDEVRPFAEKDIALLESFAAQAVIAMENARLITETREALDQQQAMTEVLGVINSSPGNLQPVFGILLEKSMHLCEAAFGGLWIFDGDRYVAAALRGVPPDYAEFLQGMTQIPGPGSAPYRFLHGERSVIQNVDLKSEELYRTGDPQRRALVDLGGARTAMQVPLCRDDAALGVITLYRQEVRPFSEKQIALLQSFAAQAVIAMDNARLLDEIRQRQAELRVTFDNMGDGVAMFDAELRLAAWNMNFEQLLELPKSLLDERPSFADFFRYLSARGEFDSADLESELGRSVEDAQRELRFERTRPDGRVVEVRRNPVPGGGFVIIYSDITERKRAEAEVHAARDAAEKALAELQAAQRNLIHAEKMASLGQLTAGIAHEIKNPLNFVNNFAGISVELLDELKESAAPAIEKLDDNRRADLDDTIEMLTGNLQRIAEHGRRADGIVRSMLLHSRGGSGEWQPVDLNGLIDEALNLAYHGARAQDQSFNITMERDLDAKLAPIEVVPQDITRVFLNLFGNGFYAAAKKARESGGDRPVLKVTTRDLGDAVEVRIRDNGTGIPPESRNRLFQPFFTTKPTGEGTGLGLSISYDIVTQQHGGTIGVESEVGAFTEFTVRLPRRAHGMTAGRAA